MLPASNNELVIWKEHVICCITWLKLFVSIVLVNVCAGDLAEAADGDFADTIKFPQPPCKPQLPQGRWRRALHPFRPPRKLSKSREQNKAADLCPPSITLSSPELVSFTLLKLL